jgi:hypothetical protein
MWYIPDKASGGIPTKFHEVWFWHSSNIKVMTSTISLVAVLVLLMVRIYEIHCLYGLRWHYIHGKFCSGIQFRKPTFIFS